MERTEECAVGVFEELAQVGAVFLRLEDSVEGVDIRDAVSHREGTIEDDMVVCVMF